MLELMSTFIFGHHLAKCLHSFKKKTKTKFNENRIDSLKLIEWKKILAERVAVSLFNNENVTEILEYLFVPIPK